MRVDTENVLTEFGNTLGLSDLAFDETNACKLVFDGRHAIQFELDRDAEFIYLHAELGSAPAQATDLRALLEAGFLGTNAGGGAFGISPDNGQLFLWKRLRTAYLTVDALFAETESFVHALRFWQTKIAAGQFSLSTGEDPEQNADSSLTMLRV